MGRRGETIECSVSPCLRVPVSPCLPKRGLMSKEANGLQTEYEFTLPKGYVDAEGQVRRKGCMRLATAMDEIAPLRDPRVRDNQAYLTVAILARVVTQLEGAPQVNTNLIETLFTADLAYLQDLYRQINGNASNQLTVTCPNCEHTFQAEANAPGES